VSNATDMERARALVEDVAKRYYPTDFHDAVQRTVASAIAAALAAERERAAMLHEQVNNAPGREPMAVIIEYRDRIRGTWNG